MPSDQDLLNAIDAFEGLAYGSDAYGGELSRQRSLAIEAFQGVNIEPAPEGRSQVQDRSVLETVFWIMPSLIRIHAGGQRVVEFEPVGPEDEEAAEQESEHLNHLVQSKTDWELICRQWFQDALITRNAYCMAYIDERVQVEHETYEGLTEIQLAALTDEGMEIVAAEAREGDPEPMIDPTTGQQLVDPFTGEPMEQPSIVYDVEVRNTETIKRLCFDVLPPENVRVSENQSDFTLTDCDYFEYYEMVTISDLRKQGYEIPDDIMGDDFQESEEDYARDRILETDITRAQESNLPDPSMRLVKVRTIWVRYDYDEDGIAELQKVIVVGRNILDREEATRIPVASIVPFINTHRHIGMSVADLTFDIQRIKTALIRSGLDSLYLANNPRHAISRKVHIDDYLTSRPGAPYRVDTDLPDVGGHMAVMPTENTFPYAREGLEHMDRVIESRVGVNRMFQGIDSSNLNDHDRIGQLSTMAAQRVEDIARLFGYGVKELFSIAHELIIKHNHQQETVRLKGDWVQIDPSQWKTGRDMQVVAPYAAGNKDSLLQRLLIVGNIHEKALAGGLPIVTPDDSYQLGLAIADAADLQGTKYFTDPATIPPPPPPPDYTAMALEVENKKVDNEALDEGRKSELDKYKADLNARVEEFKVQANAELQIALKQLEQEGRVDVEKTKANLKVSPIQVQGKQMGVSEAFLAAQKANEQMAKTLEGAMEKLSEAIESNNAEREIVRDESGRPVGVRRKG